ncbi:MAG: putative dehydrogenase [Patiriisocius sp.]|jgi:predicted dehydrogenase
MKKLTIGVMGCAAIAKSQLIPAIIATKQFNLVAVASRSKEKAMSFASLFDCEPVVGYKNLLQKPGIDAIYMPLPTGLHYKWILECLHAGKHVFVEKSLAHNYIQAKEIVALAKKNKLALMENYMFQYHSQHQFVFDLIKRKEIGELRILRANFGFPPLAITNFRYNEKMGGGALLDAAGYTVKAVHFLLGKDFKVKAANLFQNENLGTNIYGGAFLDNGRGVSAQLGFGFDNFYQSNYELWGSKGKITCQRAFTAKPDFAPAILLEKQDERKEFVMDMDNHFVGSIKEFYQITMHGGKEKHYEDILWQSKTLEDIRRLSK